MASLLLYKGSEQSRKKAIILSRMEGYVEMVERIDHPDSLLPFLPADLRLTLIDSVGNVIFDSYDVNLSSHADRPEIREALEKGKGLSLRKSETSDLPYIYYARKTEGGGIIRVAQVFEADLQHFLQTDWPLLAGIIAIALAALLSIYILIDKHQSLEKALQEDEKRRLKHEMTGNISHELKTPVAGLQGYLEILVNHPDCPQDKRKLYTERAYMQSLRLSDLIRDISLVTKMEEAPSQFSCRKLYLKAVVDEIIDEMSDRLTEHKMSCLNNIPEGCEIEANSQLLYAIFRNLLENSVKYAGDGVEVRIEGTPDG